VEGSKTKTGLQVQRQPWQKNKNRERDPISKIPNTKKGEIINSNFSNVKKKKNRGEDSFPLTFLSFI
jgi:hypothetical protein